ncbi:MAG: bifunctional serine/threonine-protein kinase/formylglycine-generating enzyme family protein [Candidatus Contendobacter sp.]|nr:bifunctional serine/threonine-protein kinase/formylglycine-generating enzyme family protein [Candidatus Contendobacter sp.]
MNEPPEETPTQSVDVIPPQWVDMTCPGCFHPHKGDTVAVCSICKYRPNADRSGALLAVGTQLRRYVIGEKLGQGGFGITYRGFDLKLHMKVAVKEYYPSDFVGRSTDRKTVMLNAREHEELFGYGLKTFLKEARTLAQIKHPRVVRVLNYFEMHGTAYLVMDYLEGEDLATYLKRQPDGRLSWRSAVNLLLPVLDGLRKVHEAGFMHRDLKPGNLYWTDDGLVLLDFGSARQVASPHSRSLLIFSAGYAPYEQYLEGHLNRQGPWTDVYGAAATLYFMLTARRLPSAPDRRDSSRLRQPDLLKPAREWVPDVPEALDAVLGRALAVEPEQRLQSMEEFKWELEMVLAAAEKPVAEQPPPRPRVAPKLAVKPPPEPPLKPRAVSQPSAQPNRRALVITVTVAIAGLAWGGWWMFMSSSAPLVDTPPPVVVAPLEPVKPPVVEPLPPLVVTPPELPKPSVVVTPPVAEPAPIAQSAPLPTIPTQPVIEPKMVRITGGRFQMGSPALEIGRDSDERQHWVSVQDFEIGQYEVTQKQWQTVMGNNPSYFENCADCPVEKVSWNDVQDYLRQLNQQTGKTYRLPTEAEWEYACRGGKVGEVYCGGDDVNRLAWYDENSDSKTHSTGKKAANGYGLYDMSGNVWEWICSSYDEKYGGAEVKCVQKDATGPLALRGGSWYNRPAWVRSADRAWDTPTYRNDDVGFRLARSL